MTNGIVIPTSSQPRPSPRRSDSAGRAQVWGVEESVCGLKGRDTLPEVVSSRVLVCFSRERFFSCLLLNYLGPTGLMLLLRLPSPSSRAELRRLLRA